MKIRNGPLETSSNGLKAGSVETNHTVFQHYLGKLKTLNILQDYSIFGITK